jgi:predicted ATP-dependent serine protease
VLFGRQRERGVLDRLLVGARDGHGGAIVVLGEPGIGKTALIEQAVTSAQDLRVLRTGAKRGRRSWPMRRCCSFAHRESIVWCGSRRISATP